MNLAARVAAHAHGGQVLGTKPIAAAARDAGLTAVDLGAFSLRNLSEPVELFEVHVHPGLAGSTVDPVCRMRVERDDAAGRLRHESADFWFCSLHCAGRFAVDPSTYAGGSAGTG